MLDANPVSTFHSNAPAFEAFRLSSLGVSVYPELQFGVAFRARSEEGDDVNLSTAFRHTSKTKVRYLRRQFLEESGTFRRVAQ
jgi:hypothetical protein